MLKQANPKIPNFGPAQNRFTPNGVEGLVLMEGKHTKPLNHRRSGMSVDNG
jgi:hypothetical protein